MKYMIAMMMALMMALTPMALADSMEEAAARAQKSEAKVVSEVSAEVDKAAATWSRVWSKTKTAVAPKIEEARLAAKKEAPALIDAAAAQRAAQMQMIGKSIAAGRRVVEEVVEGGSK